jgi:hypothetical protein
MQIQEAIARGVEVELTELRNEARKKYEALVTERKALEALCYPELYDAESQEMKPNADHSDATAWFSLSQLYRALTIAQDEEFAWDDIQKLDKEYLELTMPQPAKKERKKREPKPTISDDDRNAVLAQLPTAIELAVSSKSIAEESGVAAATVRIALKELGAITAPGTKSWYLPAKASE